MVISIENRSKRELPFRMMRGICQLSARLFRAFDHPVLRAKLRLNPVLDAAKVNHALLIEQIARDSA
jgi:hypothetical protein